MNGTPIAACSGIFYDSGGSAGDYSNNQNLNTTICPDGTSGSHVLLSFDSVVLAPGDQLCFLDGSSVLAPMLACASDFTPGQPFQVQATASNLSGCLTLTFVSNASGTASGWSATLSCVPPCLFPAPDHVQVISMNSGNMVWSWSAVPGSTGYEASVNGGGWQPANGNLSHTVSGLTPGDLVVLEIRALSNIPNCPSASITVNKTYSNCTLAANVSNLKAALCSGTSTGSATITVTGALGSVQFYVDSNPVPFNSGNLNNIFAAGLHQVVVQDTAGCLDTVSFTITEPAPLTATITVTDAECHGDDSGAIMAAAGGGTPIYTYAWQGCQGGPVVHDSLAIDLFAGCYAVTITDKNGCTLVAKDSIKEPPMFNFTSVQDSVSCFGGNDGTAKVTVAGSHPPYTYLWSNGDTTQLADQLKAGYHSVTITDKNGCKAVTLVQVLEPPKLVIDSISTTQILCFGGNNGAVAVFAHGGVKSYTYKWSNSGVTAAISNLIAGTYSVTVTDQNGCTVLSSAVLSAPPNLTLQFSANQPETCAGACDGKLTLGIAGGILPYSINWSSPLIPPGSQTAQQLCPGSYQVTVTDANGCSKTNTAVVKAAVPITLQFTAIPPKCAGDQNGSLAVSGTGGTLPYKYAWNTGATTMGLQNIGCGIFTVTVTDSTGCVITASDTLPCPAAVLLDSIVSYPVRCFGEANGRIHVGAHGGTGLLDYDWSDPNQQFDTIAVNLPPGIYTVTISDSKGCSVTATASITEPPPLSAILTPTPIPCFGGNNGTVQAAVTGGAPPYQYTWNVPQTTPTITGLPAGTYSLTVVDAYNCPYSGISAVITQPTTPVQVITAQTHLACFGASDGAAMATASGSNGPPYTYQWSNSASGPSPVTFNAGTYTVTATDSKGCTGTQTVDIQERSKIEVDVAVIPPTCNGQINGQAAVNKVDGGAGNGITANYHFHWSVAGTSDTVYISGLAGNTSYGLTVTDNAGCTAEFDFFLADQMPIVPVLSTDSVSCFGLADGKVVVSNIQSKRPIAEYRWNTNATGQTLINVPIGTYVVTATDTQGCTGTAAATVLEPPLLKTQLQVQPLICNSDSNGVLKITASGGTPAYSFHWNNGQSQSELSGLGPGGYAFTVTDQHGCTATDSTYLVQPNPPAITVEKTPPTCYGSADGLFRLLVSGGAMPYLYSLNGQSFEGSSVFLGLSAGSYTAYVLDGAGCKTAVTVDLDQPMPVQVSLGPDTSITLGDSLLLEPDIFNAIGMPQYRWRSTLLDSLGCTDVPDCPSVWVHPLYSNTYLVTVTDANGCTAMASIRVNVEKPRGVYVPSGFSPNGDGHNDRLSVYGKSHQIKRIKIFRIYDRWGELVFEDLEVPVNDASRGWDGQWRGSPCQAGVYVWYVEAEYLDGYEQALKGNTTLIR